MFKTSEIFRKIFLFIDSPTEKGLSLTLCKHIKKVTYNVKEATKLKNFNVNLVTIIVDISNNYFSFLFHFNCLLQNQSLNEMSSLFSVKNKKYIITFHLII